MAAPTVGVTPGALGHLPASSSVRKLPGRASAWVGSWCQGRPGLRLGLAVASTRTVTEQPPGRGAFCEEAVTPGLCPPGDSAPRNPAALGALAQSPPRPSARRENRASAQHKVMEAKKTLVTWKKAYFETRAKIEASGREARWEFDRKRLFERTDYMAGICQDLANVLQVGRPGRLLPGVCRGL